MYLKISLPTTGGECSILFVTIALALGKHGGRGKGSGCRSIPPRTVWWVLSRSRTIEPGPSNEAMVSMPVLVLRDDCHGGTRAYALETKAMGDDRGTALVKAIVEDIRDTGFRKIISKPTTRSALKPCVTG